MSEKQLSLESLRSAVELACQPQNAGVILRGREAVLAMPCDWVIQQIASVAEEALNLDDEWEYRRLLELVALLDSELVQRFVERGLKSGDPELQSAAEDFRRT